MSGQHLILIVEDDLIIAATAELALVGVGFRVVGPATTLIGACTWPAPNRFPRPCWTST